MQIAIPVVIVLVVVLVAGVLLARGVARRGAERETEVRHHPSLTYLPPRGQDPAAVLAALENNGFHAVSRDSQVVIVVPEPADRERVRELIAGAALNLEGDPTPPQRVTFTDE